MEQTQVSPASTTKRCPTCGEEKPTTEFSKHKTRADGLRGECKPCRRESYRKYRAANPEKVRESYRKRYAANPEKKRESNRKWRAANPEKKRESNRKWQAANLEKKRESNRKWQAANLERVRESRLKHLYGLTPAQHDAMVQHQHGVCAICGSPPAPGKVLHVDHDHATNKVREMLCSPCNTSLGGFKDSPELLIKAATYLQKHKPATPREGTC